YWGLPAFASLSMAGSGGASFVRNLIRQRLADPKSDLYIENEEIPGSRAIARMLGPAPLSCSALIL
ncbi:hypothetical protein, partial [Thiolapillus sp.]|uniref:hypothetical protein n=1 Tax=Thiolapillus sp. TaxID=2017437 RepID=UPI003AF8D21A